MSRDPRKKRSPRESWKERERAEKQAIAKSVRQANGAGEPKWIDMRGKRSKLWDRTPMHHPVDFGPGPVWSGSIGPARDLIPPGPVTGHTAVTEVDPERRVITIKRSH